MEMDSGSLTESGGSSTSSPPNSSSESLNGLKFGQKIYFEDVGIAALPKSGGGSSSYGATPSKKVRGGGAQAGQPPRCQVEGCKVDLSDAKAYYSRHKVCGTHSKSPMVIVAGLEQRFCQQCSRFHQLPEFDQGKRSCRRRLAGHNERRRKPPPGSLLSTRYARLSSSIFENSNGVGSFLMDFSGYQRSSERIIGNQTTTAMGKYLLHTWHNNSESSFPGGASFPGPGITSGECVTGVTTDSTCALSLLSNQPWGSRNRTSSGFGANALMNADMAPMVQTTAASWGFKGNEAASSSSQQMTASSLGLSQISQPPLNIGMYSGDFQLSQESEGQYMELGHSTQQMHWSL